MPSKTHFSGRVIALLLFFLLLLLFPSCSSLKTDDVSAFTQADLLDALFEEYASYRGCVCMGISGAYTDRDSAVEAATRECVQILAFYRGLAFQADYDSIIRSSTKMDTFTFRAFGGTTDAIYEEVVSEMEIVDVRWYGGSVGAVVYARLPEMTRVENWSDGDWREDKPEIEGYYSAVATSDGTYTLVKSALEAATFRTAQALLDVDESAINVSVSNVTTDRDSYKRDSYSISGNRLEGFQILDYEYDRDTKKIYALGICRK